MKILLHYLKPYWRILAVALLLAAVNQFFSMLDPLILGKMIDNYANKFKSLTSSQFLQGVLLSLLLLIGVAMISRVAKNFQDYFVNVILQKTGADIYTAGIRHSLELPYEVFEDQRSGETLGQLQKLRSDIEKLLTSLVNVLFTSVVGIIIVVIYTARVYWVIAPIYFSAIPIIGIISSVLSRKIKTMQKQIVAETTALAGSTTESLRNIELVKSLGLSQQEIQHLNNTTTKILKLELRKVRYIRSLGFIQGTCVNFLRVCILGVMMYLIFSQRITVGEFTTLFIYSFFIFGPLQELGNIINVFREAEVSLGNFKKIMDTPRERSPLHPEKLGKVRTLEFNHVTFQHRSSNRPSVKNISFKVAQGETIAFVGPSGAGKTTLVKLLVGLYRPQEGRILYNDLDAEHIQLEELRNQIGFVTQDTQLFSGTIKENLLFVNPNASDEEIMDVLKKSACDQLLARANQGIQTLIGEGGVKVSGGEKQRLSIARALLRKPALLVFDEATSSLDSLTEEEISETIRNVSENERQITILIAHRLSTIMHADRIYVLERGQIVEVGRHEELINDKGLYYAMWRQQVGERGEEKPELIPVLQ